MRGRFLLLLTLLPLVSCKPKSALSERALPSASASSSAAEPVAAKLRPVAATDVKVVRCNLPAVPPPDWIKGGWNNVAASRHLHLAGDGSLYFFPDHLPPVKLVATNDGCGYRLEGPLPEKKDAAYGLEPDGSIAEHPLSDDSKKTKCRVKALTEYRYGRGALFGTRYVYPDHASLMEMDLASDGCEAKDSKFPELPADVGSVPSLAPAGSGEFLIAVARADWRYDKEIFRYDRSGKLVGRVGDPDAGVKIGGDVAACGDGFCLTTGWSWLEIRDRTGKTVTTLKMGELTKLESPMIEGVAELNGKGVFVLIGYQPKGQPGRAELVRLDGVD